MLKLIEETGSEWKKNQGWEQESENKLKSTFLKPEFKKGLDEQKRLVRADMMSDQIGKTQRKPKEQWYILSQSWFAKWQKFVDTNPPSLEQALACYPGAPDNSDIIRLDCNFIKHKKAGSKHMNAILREGAKEGGDYLVISKGLWSSFVNLFGRGREIIRYSIQRDFETVVEVRYPELKLYIIPPEYYPQLEPQSFFVSINDTVRDIKDRINAVIEDAQPNISLRNQSLDFLRLWQVGEADYQKVMIGNYNQTVDSGAKISIKGKELKHGGDTTYEDLAIALEDIILVEYIMSGRLGGLESVAPVPQKDVEMTDVSELLQGQNYTPSYPTGSDYFYDNPCTNLSY